MGTEVYAVPGRLSFYHKDKAACGRLAVVRLVCEFAEAG